MPKLAPQEVEFRASQFSAGRCFVSEGEAIALRDALTAGRPEFNSSGDVLEDLGRLVPIHQAAQRSPGAPQGATPAPVPATANSATVPRTAPPASGPAHVPAPAAGAAKSPSGAGAAAGLLAEYESARHDPSKLSALFSDPEKGRALRELAALGEETFDRVSGACASPSELLAQYAALRNDPRALGMFLDKNRAAIRRFLRSAA